MGRVEILMRGGILLNRQDWQASALQAASEIVQDARANAGYRLLPNLPNRLMIPSLFQGLSGIGYSLLRLGTNDPIYPMILACD
jgi:lantibiotic modifying enzyme